MRGKPTHPEGFLLSVMGDSFPKPYFGGGKERQGGTPSTPHTMEFIRGGGHLMGMFLGEGNFSQPQWPGVHSRTGLSLYSRLLA